MNNNRSRTAALFVSLPDIGALLLILLGGTALIGWAFDLELARSVLPGLTAMRPQSAICFILCAVSIIGFRHVSRRYQLAFFMSAVGVFCFASLILLLQIEALVAPPIELPVLTEMAMGTALGLALGSAGVSALYWKHRQRLTLIFAVLTLCIGSIAVLGYLYGIDPFSRLFLDSYLALNTAIGLVILGISILFADSSSQVYRMFTGEGIISTSIRQMIPTLIITPIVLQWMISQAERAGMIQPSVATGLFVTLNIILLVTLFTSNMLTIERSMRERDTAQAQVSHQANLLEHVSDAIIATDPRFNIQFWGRAAEQTYGWKASEVIGKSVSDVLRTTYLTEDEPANVQANFAQKGAWQGEVIQLDRYGNAVPILSSVVQMRDSTNTLIGVIAVNRDIRWRKALEARLAESEKQRILMEAEREMIELRQQLVTMISHDFRTPLAVISTASQLLQNYADRMEPGRRSEVLTQIVGQVGFMRSLLDDVLVISRLQAGKLEAKPAEFQLRLLCEEVVQQTRLAYPDHQPPSFEFRCPQPYVYLDKVLLRRVLDNLMTNAMKYSSEDSPVMFRVWCEGERVYFEVEDHGIGIPEEDQPYLFDMFHRGSNAHQINGTGWGLVIVKESVQVHGGEISLASKEGKGTTFTFWLPNTPMSARPSTVA